MEVSGQLYTLTASLPEKEPPYPLDTMLGGPHSLSGGYGEVIILYPEGTRTPTPVIVLVATRYTGCVTATHYIY